MKAHQSRVALLAVVAFLAAALLLGCGSPFEVATSAPDRAEAGGPEAALTPDGGGQPDSGGSPDASPDVYAVEASADGDAGPDAPGEWILCTTSTYSGSLESVSVPFGCGSGWDAAQTTIGSPAQQAARAAVGPYVISLYPAAGPPVRCASTDPPVPQGLCPWTVSSSDPDAFVECVVTGGDGGVLGAGPSCQSEEAP